MSAGTYNAHVDGRMAGAALQPLQGAQIRRLVLLARQAFEKTAAPGETFDDWRHQHVLLAVERPGLRACRNEDFLPLKAHFLRLLGARGAAENADLRAMTEPRRMALHQLGLEAKKAEAAAAAANQKLDALAYARGFLRRKRGVDLDQADARTIWHAVYLLRRKGNSYRAIRGGQG